MCVGQVIASTFLALSRITTHLLNHLSIRRHQMLIQLCDYGCGQEAIHQFKNGKWCCSKSQNKCSVMKIKNSDSNSGKNHHYYGSTRSEKTKLKISESLMGNIPWNKGKTGVYSEETIRQISDAKKGQPGTNKGKIFSEVHRRNISKNHADVSLQNNPNWKGGISCEPYCQVWVDQDYKESIKKRDKYQCLNPACNHKSKNLCLHHIDYNKKNCHPNNLIVLCISCNAKANFDRKWHTEWYKRILNRRYNI